MASIKHRTNTCLSINGELTLTLNINRYYTQEVGYAKAHLNPINPGIKYKKKLK